MARKVICPICEERRVFKDRDYLITHIGKYHKDCIPEGWDAGRYENFLRTGKEHGTCVYCGKETKWNPDSKKYYRMCGSAACKKKASDIAEANLKKKTGMTKSERMKLPETQRKMVYAKHTSGKYNAGDHDIMYDSSYAKEFVVDILANFLGYNMKDVYGPSLNTYKYIFEGKEHIYIPDFLIQSYGLEIEIKDGGDNPNMHPKIQAVDKKKEAEKDKVMMKLQSEGKLRYIKIVNKDYTEFFKLISELNQMYDGDQIVKGSPSTDIRLLEEGVIDIAIDIAKGVEFLGTYGKDILYQSDVVQGKRVGYMQLIPFYYKKIKQCRNMQEFNALKTQIQRTYDSLVSKKNFEKEEYGHVEKDLEDVIKEMEDHVFRELEVRESYLLRKEERKRDGKPK